MIYDLFPLFSRVKFARVDRPLMCARVCLSLSNILNRIISVHIGAIKDATFLGRYRDPTRLQINRALE